MTEHDTHAGLRDWGRGWYATEAAVELLIRSFGGRFASARVTTAPPNPSKITMTSDVSTVLWPVRSNSRTNSDATIRRLGPPCPSRSGSRSTAGPISAAMSRVGRQLTTR